MLMAERTETGIAVELSARSDDLVRRIYALSPGERLVYWTGNLAEDCERVSDGWSGRARARTARDGAQRAAEMGYCLLTVRRVEARAFAYVAVRTRR